MVLNSTVLIFVFPADQTDVFPAFKPAGHIAVLGVVHRVYKIESGEGTYCRGSGVQQGNEDQRVAGRFAGIRDPGHSEETHDDMWQTGGANH